MGKKKDTAESSPPVVEKAEAGEDEEDSPVIKELKDIDEKYCAIEVELEQEIEKLRQKYDERQAPLLEERKKALLEVPSTVDDEDKKKGTPALQGFWLQALQNAGDTEDCVRDCDEPVLEYLQDITKSDLDPACPQKGVILRFHFVENPYFTNDVLTAEFHFDYDLSTYKPWKDPDCIEVKGCEIEWKPGKDVTVEKKAPKPKAGKKGRTAGKSKEEPCPSFFRIVFTSCKKGGGLPEGLECFYEEDEDIPDDMDMEEVHLSNAGCLCQFLSQEMIPYAVRYYSGEACEEEDDDDEGEESEEEDEDDDDDDESEDAEEEDEDDDDDDESEDEPAPKAKSKGKKDAAGGKPGEKTEECKQQ